VVKVSAENGEMKFTPIRVEHTAAGN